MHPNTFYIPFGTIPRFFHHTQNPVNNLTNVTIHLPTQFCCTHLQPMANKLHRLSDVIRLSALQSGKYFHPFKLPQNA